MSDIDPATPYEICARCDHFVEENDIEAIVFGAATYLHLDDGEKEHDHDALPSGDVRTFGQWRADRPDLFAMTWRWFAEPAIGPNAQVYVTVGRPIRNGELRGYVPGSAA